MILGRAQFESALDEPRLSSNVTPATQLRTLRTLLVHVRRAAESSLSPIVEIDLDLTALMPVYRTRQALVVAGRAVGIEMFTKPEVLDILPGYSDEAWMSFVRNLDLETICPNIQWTDSVGGPNKDTSGPFAIFHEAYWKEELIEDTPTPGLGSFVHRVREVGGEVVFVSGRWLQAQVAPTLVCLRRAGIPEPKLVIGNDRHETLVPPERALSDAQAKVLHQQRIRNFGTPVAIVDDRASNRAAIIEHVGVGVLGVAISIPGFTHDPATDNEALRISTFETFDTVLGESPFHPYVYERYRRLGAGLPWRGTYEGLGRNDRSYVLPRIYSSAESLGPGLFYPFADLIRSYKSGTLDEGKLLELCTASIPSDELIKLEQCTCDAKHLAEQGLAAPFPEKEKTQTFAALPNSFMASLPRDVELLMTTLGYRLAATGVHDIDERVAGRKR